MTQSITIKIITLALVGIGGWMVIDWLIIPFFKLIDKEG